MKIDYRKEVDSGYDRKVMVEKIILELLNQGVPPEIISEGSNFNIRHREMLNNLKKGYMSKIEQLEDLYDTFYETPEEGLGKSYSEVVHNLQELYPMTPQEEKEKFSKRDELNKKIKQEQNKDLKSMLNKKELLINKIAKLKIKYPILDVILDMTEEMDILIENGQLTAEKMDELFKKYNFDKSKYEVYNLIYKNYINLTEELSDLISKIITAEDGKVYNKEIETLTQEKNKLEEELLKRSLKLVNYFIRSKYKNLLVEQEELHSICLIGLTNAMRDFDVKKGYKFSTFAFAYMDTEVKRNFKILTGYRWEPYWKKQKIKTLLETTSNLLERKATVEDLYELGFIDLSYDEVRYYSNLPSIYLDSYLYGDFNLEQERSTFEEYEELDNYENERYNKNSTYEDEVEILAIKENLKYEINEVLLNALTDRERIVLVLRYGLDMNVYLNDLERDYFKRYANKQLTQKETGEIMNLSHTRICDIEKKAIRKLKRPLHSQKLK